MTLATEDLKTLVSRSKAFHCVPRTCFWRLLNGNPGTAEKTSGHQFSGTAPFYTTYNISRWQQPILELQPVLKKTVHQRRERLPCTEPERTERATNEVSKSRCDV